MSSNSQKSNQSTVQRLKAELDAERRKSATLANEVDTLQNHLMEVTLYQDNDSEANGYLYELSEHGDEDDELSDTLEDGVDGTNDKNNGKKETDNQNGSNNTSLKLSIPNKRRSSASTSHNNIRLKSLIA